MRSVRGRLDNKRRDVAGSLAFESLSRMYEAESKP
jgi:hypothetical protein